MTDMTDKMKSFRVLSSMTLRNIKVYAKDRMAILLSLLTQIIVLTLYLLFLKANYVDVINEQLAAVKNLVNKADIEALVNSWLVSGVIGTSVVTVALNTLNLMVKDREDKIDFDYRASAVHGSTVVMSYFFGSVACTFITSSVLLSAGYVFLAATGTFCLTVPQMLQTYALTLLGGVEEKALLIVAILARDNDMLLLGTVNQEVIILAVIDAGYTHGNCHKLVITLECATLHSVGEELDQIPRNLFGGQWLLDIVLKDILTVEIAPVNVVLGLRLLLGLLL